MRKAWHLQRASESKEIRRRRLPTDEHAQHLHDMRTRKAVREGVELVRLALDELAARGLDVPHNEGVILRRAGDARQRIEDLINELAAHFGQINDDLLKG